MSQDKPHAGAGSLYRTQAGAVSKDPFQAGLVSRDHPQAAAVSRDPPQAGGVGRSPSARHLPRVGVLPSGPGDSICDVAGVTVGHATLASGATQTGVTVVRPHAGDVYRDKVPAAATVLNGFGKSVGLVQVQELGVLETPIALTNTFSVGTVANAQIRHAVRANPTIGREAPTVNPLVFECNDGYLNDIQAMAVSEADYAEAYARAGSNCQQGAVGAGRGMSCFSLKGGIGSASRMASVRGEESRARAPWTVGVLVLANFGRLPSLTVAGRPFGRWLVQMRKKQAAQVAAGEQGDTGFQADADTQGDVASQADADTQGDVASEADADTQGDVASEADVDTQGDVASQADADARDDTAWQADADAPEKGSIILLLATDAPLDARQLRRLSLRAGAGLARTGSSFGHGSGDIALAFSTAYTVPHDNSVAMPAIAMLHESLLDPLFEAAAEATEQAIVNALWHADTVAGRDGHVRQCLREAIPAWRQWLDDTLRAPCTAGESAGAGPPQS
jgi:D-aminopeptidase